MRWHHPSKGMLAPDQFLPLAESTGLIVPLGEWILRQACLDAAAWPPHIRIAVNISAVQFTRVICSMSFFALADSGLSPDRLELEIADSGLLEAEQARHLPTIQQLKNLGVSIVLDNCGAGYSAASYLTSFPFDKIKIDRSTRRRACEPRDHGGGGGFRGRAGAWPRYCNRGQGSREPRAIRGLAGDWGRFRAGLSVRTTGPALRTGSRFECVRAARNVA